MMNTEIDRINNLPDGILDHIVSFLPTKEAVQKSLVSKQWANLWASLSRLNIDENDFIGDQHYEKLKKFGDMVLNHRESSCIHTIQIKIFSDYRLCDLFRTFILSSKKFNPRVISVEVPLAYSHSLEFMFWFESVEDMSLKINRFRYWAVVPNCVYLPCLKKLSINNYCLAKDSFIRLFEGCPLLEDLSLEGCIGRFSILFRQKLSSLSLVECYDTGGSGEFELVLSNALPETVDLPCIRRLKIQKGRLDEQSICKLLTGCPLLEELILEDCYCECLTLLRRKIKCLFLNNCSMITSQQIGCSGPSSDIEVAFLSIMQLVTYAEEVGQQMDKATKSNEPCRFSSYGRRQRRGCGGHRQPRGR